MRRVGNPIKVSQVQYKLSELVIQGGLRGQKKIFLHDQRINIVDRVDGIQNVEILDLHNNNIVTLNNFKQFTSIISVNLSCNNIVDFFEIFNLSHLHKTLEQLNLLANPITNHPLFIPTILNMFPKLKFLNKQPVNERTLANSRGPYHILKSALIKLSRNYQNLLALQLVISKINLQIQLIDVYNLQINQRVGALQLLRNILDNFRFIIEEEDTQLKTKLIHDVCVLQIDVYQLIDMERATNELERKQEEKLNNLINALIDLLNIRNQEEINQEDRQALTSKIHQYLNGLTSPQTIQQVKSLETSMGYQSSALNNSNTQDQNRKIDGYNFTLSEVVQSENYEKKPIKRSVSSKMRPLNKVDINRQDFSATVSDGLNQMLRERASMKSSGIVSKVAGSAGKEKIIENLGMQLKTQYGVVEALQEKNATLDKQNRQKEDYILYLQSQDQMKEQQYQTQLQEKQLEIALLNEQISEFERTKESLEECQKDLALIKKNNENVLIYSQSLQAQIHKLQNYENQIQSQLSKHDRFLMKQFLISFRQAVRLNKKVQHFRNYKNKTVLTKCFYELERLNNIQRKITGQQSRRNKFTQKTYFTNWLKNIFINKNGLQMQKVWQFRRMQDYWLEWKGLNAYLKRKRYFIKLVQQHRQRSLLKKGVKALRQNFNQLYITPYQDKRLMEQAIKHHSKRVFRKYLFGWMAAVQSQISEGANYHLDQPLRTRMRHAFIFKRIIWNRFMKFHQISKTKKMNQTRLMKYIAIKRDRLYIRVFSLWKLKYKRKLDLYLKGIEIQNRIHRKIKTRTIQNILIIQLASSRHRSYNLQQEIYKNREELDNQAYEIHRSEQEKIQILTKLEHLLEDYNNSQNQLDDMRQYAQGLQYSLEQLEESLNVRQNTVDEYKILSEDQQLEIQVVREQVDRLVKEKQELEQNYERLYKELQMAEIKIQSLTKYTEEDLMDINQELKRKVTNENIILREECRAHKDQQNQMQDEIFRLKEQVNTHEIMNIRQKVANERLQVITDRDRTPNNTDEDKVIYSNTKTFKQSSFGSPPAPSYQSSVFHTQRLLPKEERSRIKIEDHSDRFNKRERESMTSNVSSDPRQQRLKQEIKTRLNALQNHIDLQKIN